MQVEYLSYKIMMKNYVFDMHHLLFSKPTKKWMLLISTFWFHRSIRLDCNFCPHHPTFQPQIYSSQSSWQETPNAVYHYIIYMYKRGSINTQGPGCRPRCLACRRRSSRPRESSCPGIASGCRPPSSSPRPACAHPPTHSAGSAWAGDHDDGGQYHLINNKEYKTHNLNC